jgi:hypothetical protein
MFGGFLDEEQGDPTSADDGVFLTEAELAEWHRSMQEKWPQVFTADDKLYGDIGHQHPYGTKLMTWFDNDPNKPMRMEVRGSRWMIEFREKSPVYVVKPQNSNEMSQIALTSAHEDGGWMVGWDLTPPTVD